MATFTIHVSWAYTPDPAKPAEGFHIQRRTPGVAMADYATVSDPAATTFEDTAVTFGQTYYYQVAAYNQGGQSSYVPTPGVAVTVPAPPAPTSAQAQLVVG